MDEPLSVVSADSSGTSEDFEILDGSSPNSPLIADGDESRDMSCAPNSTASNGAVKKSMDAYSQKTKSAEEEFTIANNGSVADLEKQMTEVMQDMISGVTKENDSAILKSLDASPENVTTEGTTQEKTSSFASDLKEEGKVVPQTVSVASATKNGLEKHGILQCVPKAADELHPLSVQPPPCLNASESGAKAIPATSLNSSVSDQPKADLRPTSNLEPSPSSSNMTASATTLTIEKPSCDEYTIFNRISYLGAAAISSACTHEEIIQKMSILNSEHQEQAIEISLSVPSHSESSVIIYDAESNQEITRYHISTIRKCTHGTLGTPDAACFNFTTIHGSSPATSIVQCHVFRCQIPEAVGKIVDCFGAAFRRVPKAVNGVAETKSNKGPDTTNGQHLKHLFDISLEIKEEDAKGNFYTVPRDKECFKLRCNLDKELHISVAPSPSSLGSGDAGDACHAAVGDQLCIERCFGLLIAPGHNVKDADMNLLEMITSGGPGSAPHGASNASTNTKKPLTHLFALELKQVEITSSTSSLDELHFEVIHVENRGEILSSCLLIAPGHNVKNADMNLLEMITSGGPGSAPHGASNASTNGGPSSLSLAQTKVYQVAGRWDPRDPVFASLNQETPKDGRVLMSVAIDLVLTTKKPLTHLFALELKQVEITSSTSSLDELHFEVIHVENRGEVERLRPSLSLPLNLPYFAASSLLSGGARSPSISSVDTPAGDDSADDDEPLLSGSGEVSKDCPQSELDMWKEVLPRWQAAPYQFPKGLSKLVRRGVPEALRGEVWQLLAGCAHDDSMMETYRILLTKDCPSDQVILRDINRTFPAHEFFKESGGGGQDALYKISRAYAVYDEELAYCQGLSFLAASLLLHMPEEQAFCLLVKIMSDYGFRELFKDGFKVLHLRFYQLERLMEDNVNDVYCHFVNLGVDVHMFASQWLLTLFTAKFPLLMVFRYLDLFLLTGFNSVFQVAIALLMMSRKELVSQDFENVLKFFRVSLPKKFRNEDAVRQLFRIANSVKTKKLEKYEREYVLIQERESGESVAERLEQENKRLTEESMRLDAENDLLARRIDHLEEICDRAGKETAALRQTLTEAEQEKNRLMQEASQVKEMLKREVERSDKEQQRSAAIVTEYKNICSQLSQRLDNERCQHLLAIENIKSLIRDCKASDCKCRSVLSAPVVGVGSASCNAPDEAPTGSREQLNALGSQVRELELELAQTKLALVETQCKNQDVTHQLNSAISELQGQRGTWLQKTLTSISGLKERTSASSSRPLSPTQLASAAQPHVRSASIDSGSSQPNRKE
ncbi:rab GTPase-activating protein 1 [Hyalella azteca]|uniref:Rab GTPase-activating protein 1 n=1 Tax=Hyalella azteca TaxID=294128 RepID=A0A8B7NGV5_HYAAZ|nr:rab GTPase-activating protein 1 [Hyalella azteca]